MKFASSKIYTAISKFYTAKNISYKDYFKSNNRLNRLIFVQFTKTVSQFSFLIAAIADFPESMSGDYYSRFIKNVAHHIADESPV